MKLKRTFWFMEPLLLEQEAKGAAPEGYSIMIVEKFEINR